MESIGSEMETRIQTAITEQAQAPGKQKLGRPASRRPKRSSPYKKEAVSADREQAMEPSQTAVSPRGVIPRITVWICRETVIWSHKRLPLGSVLFRGAQEYKDPDTWTVTIPDYEEPHLWDYSQGFWFPAGRKVIDISTDRVLPRQFEPRDFSCLVDPRLVLYARENRKVSNKFKFKQIEESQVPVEQMDLPVPLDLDEMKKRLDVKEGISDPLNERAWMGF